MNDKRHPKTGAAYKSVFPFDSYRFVCVSIYGKTQLKEARHCK